LRAERAIAWYQDVRRGVAIRPNADGTVPRADDVGTVQCESNHWDAEPIWPGWVTGTPRVLPFIAPWHGTPRMHHLMATAFDWAFPPDEAAQLDDFLYEQMGFRRAEWNQLAGSVHLIVPNPYVREVDETLTCDSDREGIRLEVVRRWGVPAPRLRVEIVEDRPTGTGQRATALIDDEPVTLSLASTIHETSATICIAADDSVLEIRERAHFLRDDVVVEFDAVTSTRVVQVSDAHGVVDSYEVLVSHPESTKAQPPPPSAVFLLEAMLAERRIKATARTLEQQWVQNDPAAATHYVRSRIERAREQVLLADPWLGPVEVHRYALAISLGAVPIRILTSPFAFASAHDAPALQNKLVQVRASDPTLGAIEVRVMGREVLHDRFLRVDDRLYMLGNSLNGLGQRGGLMMRVPDPTPVFRELDVIWSRAEPLADYASRRAFSSGVP